MAVTDPQALVKKTTEQVLAEISAKKQELVSNPGQIYSLVDDILLPRFDFNQISRLVLGKHWKQATKEQKSAFIKEFRELLVRTYATTLLHYSGQKVSYPAMQVKPDAKRVRVRTKVQDKGAGAVPIDYSLYLRKESWKVYDVTIDGVSLVSTYRSNFNSQIKRHKLSGLISNIKQRNSKGQ
ncbi:MAG: ABC transporter substrate-binding protein [Gammaproteobacteria bacterium]|nr:ABC transporter substrate-binding protein [Gammaproteobacteria bacterium]